MLSLILSLLIAPVANASCDQQYQNRGLISGATQTAINCYEAELKNPQAKTEKAVTLERLSQLHFFMSSFEDSANAESRTRKATELAEESVLIFGPWVSEKDYLQLNSEDRRALSMSLYSYGTSFARYSEIQGTLTVVTNWPSIQKVMKLVMRLGHPDVAGYGAHRTLAIANTRMPAPFGDKKLAEQYLKFAIQKSDQGGFSSYLVNHNMLADLLFRLNRIAEACAELKIVAGVSDDQIKKLTEAGTFEGLEQRKNAQAQLKEKCVR